jgi:CRISPR-associated protein Cmr6
MPKIREPRRPVYAGAQSAQRGDGNLGLWYDKFCNQWRIDSGHWSMSADVYGNPKLAWIKQVGGNSGESTLVSDYTRRVVRLATARGGLVEVFVAESRFVTGLGRSHPVENGFAWHPTLGTPYLPGSSLKGLVKAWAVEQGRKDEAERLLGGRSTVGRVLFLDAIPVEPVRLEADVMTPHYAGWTPEEPPGDWRSPTPIPFLVAAAGTALLVAMLPACADDASELESVRVWLRRAFEIAGAGAKTAVGYGRFRPNPDRTAQQLREVVEADRATREQREREQMLATPEGRWRLRVDEATEHEVQNLVREQLEAGYLTDPVERVALARAVADAGYQERWRQGRTVTETGAKKLKALSRQIAAVLAEADDC